MLKLNQYNHHSQLTHLKIHLTINGLLLQPLTKWF